MPTETETKDEADADVELTRLDGLPGVLGTRGPELQLLEAEYYDTADFRLLRAGITLRRRKGGHDAGWHLKLPVGASSRDEIQLPLGRAGRVPAEFADLVRPRVRGEQLVPVATIVTRRERTILLGPGDRELAELADDEVHGTANLGGAGSSRWREAEVELADGDAVLLAAADKLLRRAGLRRSERAAKLERVLGGSAPARPPRLADHPTAAEVVAAYLREHAERLLALDPLVRRGEPDCVHKMRVATRRLRSTLQVFGFVLADGDSDQVAAELKWLGGVLGAERDAEVQAGRLAEHVRRTNPSVLLGPVAARIQAHDAKAAATSHAEVVTGLKSERYYALLEAVDVLIGRLDAGSGDRRAASKLVAAAVRRSYRKTRRRMQAAASELPGPARDTRLHAARKAAKRARYAAEAAIPVSGKAARRFARQMKEIQSVLGDHQDTVVGRQVSRGLGISAQLAGESAFTYGLFYGYDACSGGLLDAQALKSWQRVARPKYRAWLP